MKKIITFAVVLGVLTGGIIFYTMRVQETFLSETMIKSLPAEIFVDQGFWKDYLVPDKDPGRVFRKGNHDLATIVELTDDSITIDWDNWGIETFKKGPNSTWTR